MYRLIIALLIILNASAALAEEAKPTAISPYIHTATPFGHGTASRLFIDIYDASIWTDAKAWSMDSIFALSMKYDLDLDADDLVDNTIEEMRHVQNLPESKLEAYKKQLDKIYPDVHSGDRLTALYMPKHGITFYFNDKLAGTITDQAFAGQFFAIWFSPDTSEPALRQALLGKNS